MRSRKDEPLADEDVVEEEFVRVVSVLSREGRGAPRERVFGEAGIRGEEGKGERVADLSPPSSRPGRPTERERELGATREGNEREDMISRKIPGPAR